MPPNRHHRICWQGWSIELPRRWDPVRLEGDYSQGYALFADAVRPRLGLRWSTPRKKTDTSTAVLSALRQEVGQLACDEARPAVIPGDWESALLYSDPEPPGRDVLSACSGASRRLLQVVYHAHRRENIFSRGIVPTLIDHPADRATPWAVFDLSCVIPAEMPLVSHQLNAGDLSLTFSHRYRSFTVRQIAIASLALQRKSLDQWIVDQQRRTARHHRSTTQFAPITAPVRGHELQGQISCRQRKTRYILLRRIAASITTLALHDEPRDRLILLEGPDEDLLRAIAQTVGSID